jgi:hypothetical protein
MAKIMFLFLQEKMDTLQVGAVLYKCSVGKDSSWILFQHLRRFLGKNY